VELLRQGDAGEDRSFVVQSSTGKYFAQAVYYEVVLGSTLRKSCSTKGTGKHFVQVL
jgi:hypothetical protein